MFSPRGLHSATRSGVCRPVLRRRVWITDSGLLIPSSKGLIWPVRTATSPWANALLPSALASRIATDFATSWLPRLLLAMERESEPVHGPHRLDDRSLDLRRRATR